MKRRGFSLIEMLVATVLTAVLMAGVLVVVGGMGRDQQRLAAADAAPRLDGIMDLLRRDLIQSRSMLRSEDGKNLVLEGNAGLERRTLSGNGRLVRVTYRVEGGRLTREQRYLDDSARPEEWSELVGMGVEEVRGDGIVEIGSGKVAPTRVSVRMGSAVREVRVR